MANHLSSHLQHIIVLFILIPIVLFQPYSCSVTTIVLLGATGDLAQKYLWQSVFDLFATERVDAGTRFYIYGAARQAAEPGRKNMQAILDTLTCSEEHYENCDAMLNDFKSAVRYVQLKNEDQYAKLCNELQARLMFSCKYHDHKEDVCYKNKVEAIENGRLFYLSVPPSAYGTVSTFISRHCRPKQPKSWLRVVVEKPFGHDYASALALNGQLARHLSEDEIYRIDHYLGKSVVQNILPFR